MAESRNSEGCLEIFKDPDEEIFWGPVSEREKEIRSQLPRRTFHPSELAEMLTSGMSFQQWEDYKKQQEKEKANEVAIQKVYGSDDDATLESFNSCYSSDEEKQHNNSAESLNDTWEIQEKMLALAEKLERGEDVPEFGIWQNLETPCNKQIVEGEQLVADSQDISQPQDEGLKCMNNIQINETASAASGDAVLQNSKMIEDKEICSINKEDQIPQLYNVNAHSILQKEGPKTPVKCQKPVTTTPKKQTPNVKKDSSKGNSSLKCRPATTAVASPVALYIRSLPEPILIENVRSANKKVVYNNPNAKSEIAIKTKEGRWSLQKQSSSTESLKENKQQFDDNIKPVLPVVLHEAAASMVAEVAEKPSRSTPWARGKIGQLLQRNVTPTVLKHQGRIQMPKDEAFKSPKLMQSTLSLKSANRSANTDKDSTMDVSVLQPVVGNCTTPNKRVHRNLNFK